MQGEAKVNAVALLREVFDLIIGSKLFPLVRWERNPLAQDKNFQSEKNLRSMLEGIIQIIRHGTINKLTLGRLAFNAGRTECDQE